MKEKSYIFETLYENVQTSYKNSKVLHEAKSDNQELILFENPIFGKMLMLDGITQVTTADEFVYHEMMTHVPLFSHDNPEKVLIIGGGDGGIAREALRHPNVQSVTMVEIDEAVVRFSKEHLASVSDGAFDNPKLTLIITDGARYMKETQEKFDVIIVDSTDPVGPGAALFTKEFYTDCKKALTREGVLVTQNGVPFMQADELKSTISKFRELFKIGSCYRATIPTYAFGEMAMGWATDKDYSGLSEQEIKRKFDRAGMKTRYYTPAVHKAAFALPAYFLEILNS